MKKIVDLTGIEFFSVFFVFHALLFELLIHLGKIVAALLGDVHKVGAQHDAEKVVITDAAFGEIGFLELFEAVLKYLFDPLELLVVGAFLDEVNGGLDVHGEVVSG